MRQQLCILTEKDYDFDICLGRASLSKVMFCFKRRSL